MIVQVRNLIGKVILSPTVRVLGVFAGANMIGTIFGGVAGLLQARWIDPATMGRLNKYSILTGYVNVFLIAVADGLTRQYPYLIGKGALAEAEKVAKVAKFWYLAVAAPVMLLFGLVSIIAAFQGDWYGFVGWGAQIFAVLQITYGSYLQNMYRRSMEFKRLSYNYLVVSIVGTALVALAKFFGYWGMAIRHIVNSALRVWIDGKYLPVQVKALWDKTVFYNLVKMSIPLSLVGYIRTSFLTATFGFMVLKYCGEKNLGLYGVAVSFAGLAQTFVNSLWQIFNVKMTQRYGKDDSVTGTVKSLLKPTLFAVALAIVCAVVLCVIIKPFVCYFVPKYVAAIPIVYVLSGGMVLTAIRLPTEVLRTALKYKVIYSIAILKVVVVIGAMLMGPKTILWFATCSLLGGLSDVVCGYLFLARYIVLEMKRGT